jgi:hypothetical protein
MINLFSTFYKKNLLMGGIFHCLVITITLLVKTHNRFMNYIFTVNQIIKTNKGINLTTSIAFLGHATTFNTVIKNKFWKIMADEGFHNAI